PAIAEASNGGCASFAEISLASTRLAASRSPTRSAAVGATPSRMCARASSTGSRVMALPVHVLRSRRAIDARAPAGFFDEPDIRKAHRAIHGFQHIVNREAGDTHRCQRLHLHPGLTGNLDFRRNLYAG